MVGFLGPRAVDKSGGGMGKGSEMEHSVIMHAQARVSRNGSNVLADHHKE